IMVIAATRPILALAEQMLGGLARLGGGTPLAWWLSVLLVGPILGSFITEPAAMTICALLLARQLYALQPSPSLCYGTLGLLFVNVSVGGTLTHFAAPPVLMVAERWTWDTPFMLEHFGWKAGIGIALGSAAYALFFRNEFRVLAERARNGLASEIADPAEPVPAWVTLVHLGFLAFAVFAVHTPALELGAFLFCIAFMQAADKYQNALQLRPAILVGFFLAGLVVHGALQQWWIEPVLARLDELPLMLGATALTAFNDNAAITYLASLVPSFGEASRYAVVAGAVAGGGLTVIANAPNPAGQAILGRFFPGGSVHPGGLLLGAALPTVLVGLCFWFL
ncbi:MAG: putative Na+/H+ antiporter, partial [Solirubrobacteraceae bacterium]